MTQLETRRPPGPRLNLAALILRGFPADALRVFVAAVRDYGDIVCLRSGPWSIYLVSHPDHVRHVLYDNQKNYDKHDRFNSVLKPVLGEGLLTSDGDVWRRQRRLMQPAFHVSRLSALDALVTGETASMLDRWAASAGAGRPVDLLTEMRRLTFGILARGFFGSAVEYTSDIDLAARTFFDYFDYKTRHLLTLPDGVPSPRNRRFRRAFAAVDRVIDGIIEARRRGGERHDDLLALLLQAEAAGDDLVSDRQQVRDEVGTLLRVGYETPAVALAWTWYFIASSPDVERRLQAELAAVLGGRTPAVGDLPRLNYARAVLEESMRLYPPVWAVSRRAIGDDEIGGYRVPAGAEVVVCPYITHRHAAAWENPDVFDPSRFTSEHASARRRGAFVPFGGGLRRCIGDSFAMMEMLLIVAMVAPAYRMRLVPGHPVEPSPKFTLRPRDGVLMSLHRRGPLSPESTSTGTATAGTAS
jgi:cytochrome P450